MSDGDNVVFLAFRNTAPVDVEEVMACATCRNKTFKAVYFLPKKFPTLQCCVCGSHLGAFGWVDEERS